jgi:outer membrane protein OmpA-like peptidoglycan-associated protein
MALAAATFVVGRATAASTLRASEVRSTLAISYGEGTSTHVDMVGRNGRGKADVKRVAGRTRIHLHMDALQNPQTIGSFYTTYVLWAVAPEGQAASLAELPLSKDVDLDVTTAFQSFGLIVTAEPHSAVSLPSPMIVAENVAREDTEGRFQATRLEYSGAVGALYNAPPDGRGDFVTPLPVLGAHHAVDIARDAGADRYAADEFARVETRLADLDRAAGRHRLSKDQESEAQDVMRMAEHARVLAVEVGGQERLASERHAASAHIARAESQAEQAQQQAADAQLRAQQQGQAAEQARREADQARAGEEQARAAQDLADARAAEAQQSADEARADKDALQQQLYQSISAVLETRQEARGLVVDLSDVLFDFDRATLTPGAREKLAKLAGILAAYPGTYHLEFEGHTDSVGRDEYNLSLSVNRAAGVRGYLMQSGIPADRVGTVKGFGASLPVASNDSAEGRQLNRRVEIVIKDFAT